MLSMARRAASSLLDPTIERKPFPHAPPVLPQKQHFLSNDVRHQLPQGFGTTMACVHERVLIVSACMGVPRHGHHTLAMSSPSWLRWKYTFKINQTALQFQYDLAECVVASQDPCTAYFVPRLLVTFKHPKQSRTYHLELVVLYRAGVAQRQEQATGHQQGGL